jgi:acid phosphatase family membrane protein YuiD
MNKDDSHAEPNQPRGDGGVAVREASARGEFRETAPSQAPDSDLIVGPDATTQPAVSVVLPTMNEEAGIETCLDWIEDAVHAMGVTAEIIVSDSSTDRTPELARDRGAVVVEPDEAGYGYAYRYAFERARGDYVVMGDADTTYDFAEIPHLLSHLKRTDADIVLGNRLDGDIQDGAMPTLHRYVGNPLLTAFLNAFYDADVSDAHSGFRVVRRDALEALDLQTDGMEFASEMIMQAGARDLSIEEVPIVYRERVGEETLDSFRDGWRHVRFMLVNAPGYLFSIPGLLVGAVGLVVMAAAWSGLTSLGINAMVAGSLFTIVGYQIGTLGVFAAVAGDPIRSTHSSLVTSLSDAMTLERGATVGLVVFALGAVTASLLVVRWAATGGVTAGFTKTALAALSAIVIGLQTIFSSFYLSVIA